MKLVEEEVKRQAIALMVDTVDLMPKNSVQNHILPLLREDFFPVETRELEKNDSFLRGNRCEIRILLAK